LIAYIDSSFLVRAYLVDESDHENVNGILSDPELAAITGTWTRIEVSGALVRAARTGGGDEQGLLALLDAELGPEGAITVVAAAQEEVETRALALVRAHGLRAMDAWHLAVAEMVIPELVEPGEPVVFASRDRDQTEVAKTLGFQTL